jgi:hypothetical protein
LVEIKYKGFRLKLNASIPHCLWEGLQRVAECDRKERKNTHITFQAAEN